MNQYSPQDENDENRDEGELKSEAVYHLGGATCQDEDEQQHEPTVLTSEHISNRHVISQSEGRAYFFARPCTSCPSPEMPQFGGRMLATTIPEKHSEGWWDDDEAKYDFLRKGLADPSEDVGNEENQRCHDEGVSKHTEESVTPFPLCGVLLTRMLVHSFLLCRDYFPTCSV